MRLRFKPRLTSLLFLCGVCLAVTSASAQTTQRGPGNPQQIPPQPVFNQFRGFETPPYPYDQIRGEIVNLETQQVKPIAITQDGEIVAVGNDTDGRVVFLDTDLNFLGETRVGQGICSIVERPGLGADTGEFWVTNSHETATLVISRATFRITHVIRPAIPGTAIGAGHASTPAGLDFNHAEFTDPDGVLVPAGGRAYVAGKMSNSLIVIDAAQKSVLEVIDLTGPHNGRDIHLNEPRSVVQFQGHVYVSSHLSGNQTTTSTSLTPGSGVGPLGLDDVSIIDLDDDVNHPNRSLPDFDIARYELSTGSLLMIPDLFTIGFGMIGHEKTGRIAIGAFRSRNGEFQGEGAFPGGSVVRNGIATFRTGNPLGTQGFVLGEDLGPANDDLVLPIDIAADPEGRVYVAAYGGSKVGVFLHTGAYFGTIDTDDGPAGMAVARTLKRLYVYNRIEGTVQTFDISSTTSTPTSPMFSFTLFDPTFHDVREGRRIFNTPNSGNGATNCASCHPEARKDGLAWNLSKFFDDPPGPATEFKDFKGVMVTQDLRNLWGIAPYHWRGEQPDIDAFNGAFEGLLQGSQISQDEMDLMKSYIFSCYFPPNPLQPMNRVFSPLAKTGFREYTTPYQCDGCHRLPTGTDCSMTEVILGLPFTSPRTIESAHLVGLWSKESDIANTDDTNPNPVDETPLHPMTGFGLAHEGVVNSLEQFNRFFFNNQNFAALTEFVFEMDSGLAPFTSFCRLWNLSNANAVGRIVNYMIPQAEAGNGDLVASGRLRIGGVWTPVGLLYDPGTQSFEADTSSLGTFTFNDLKSMAQNGDLELYLYGVPFWSGERIALDRDRDGVRDGDEVAQGLDSRDPDTDGDGLWDGYDAFPLDPNGNVLPISAPNVVPGSVRVIFENTNNVKLQFETDSWTPTRIEFGETAALGFFSGDDLLPTGPANDSNLWKRKHTAFLRPQPSQGLFGLRDNTTYQFEIVTQGQNGQTQRTAVAAMPQTASDGNVNRRVDNITLVGVDNLDGTFTYTATVDMILSNGSPATGSVCVAGRFGIYDSTGAFNLFPMSSLMTNSQVIFTHTTAPGDQISGDRTCFDVPMWLEVTDCSGNPPDPMNPVSFPGRWSEGPSSVEILAP